MHSSHFHSIYLSSVEVNRSQGQQFQELQFDFFFQGKYIILFQVIWSLAGHLVFFVKIRIQSVMYEDL